MSVICRQTSQAEGWLRTIPTSTGRRLVPVTCQCPEGPQSQISNPVKSVGTHHLEPVRSLPSETADTFHCWAPQSSLGQSRWFDYHLAAPRTRNTAEGGAAGASTPPKSHYLLRVVRQDLDETRRWQAIDRLSRRLLVAESLTHPQAVPVLDAEVDRPPFFVVEPFLAGRPLAQWRDAEKESCTLSRALWTLRQLAELINAIHEHDRVHLGISPQHLLMGPDGKITLTGWCQAHQQQQRTWLPLETLDDVACLAPEAAQENYRASTASDVYAWGVVAYWLVSGKYPFTSSHPAECVVAHRQQIPLDLQVAEPNCPGPLNQLVNLALSKNPLRRPAPKYLLDCLISIEIDYLHDLRRIG